MAEGDPARYPRAVAASLRPAAVLWGLAATSYVTTEAVAASAFPGYSYARRYISDLGVPARRVGTTTIDSPLATVMNAGFVAQGVLFALAVVVAVRVLRRDDRVGGGRVLPILVPLALVHALGNGVVAVVHGGGGSADGPTTHTVGAGMAIVGGNLALLAVGGVLRRRGVVRPLGTAGVVLGVVGLISLLGLLVEVSAGSALPGLWERGSVYSITLWELVAAGVVLVPRSRPATAPTPPRR